MRTAKLGITGFSIPESCNMPGRMTFSTLDLIPQENNLLSPAVTIDTSPPFITSVYTGTKAGTYTYKDVIHIVVEFSRPVYFNELLSRFDETYMKASANYTVPAGLPFLELNSQAIALLQGYEGAGVDRRKLLFVYVVGTGEYTPTRGQLGVPAGATIQLNSGIIACVATGLEANLTSMPLPGRQGMPFLNPLDTCKMPIRNK